MTTWFTRVTLGALALATLGLASCKKDEVQATVVPATTPTLTASTSSVVLAQSNAATSAVTFTWTPISSFNWTNAVASTNPAVTYTFQFDKKGNNFAAPVNLDAGSGPNTTVSVADLNTTLQQLGLKAGQAADVEVRLRSVYAANSPLYTASVPLNATTYTFCSQPAKAWSIIGPAGVDWNTDVTLTYDCNSSTYSYSGPLKAGDFKFRYNKDWTANYGGASSTGGALTQDGSNLTITTAKNYTLVLTPGAIGSDGKAAAGSFTIK